jgi:large subunit ribosomal protein L19
MAEQNNRLGEEVFSVPSVTRLEDSSGFFSARQWVFEKSPEGTLSRFPKKGKETAFTTMAKKRIERKVPSKGVQLRLKGMAARVELVEKTTLRSDLPAFKAGDTVRVQVRIKEGEKERIQAFEGVVIAKSNRGGSKSFTVRKISHGVGVERIFLETSPKIAKVELVQSGKVRRAKIYYIRKLEGRAAKIERRVETQASAAASAAAKASSAGGNRK